MISDTPAIHLDEEEQQHVRKIIAALRYYRKYSLARVNRTESYLNTLPLHHQAMLVKYRHHLSVVRDCIDRNQIVIKKMLCENLLGSKDDCMNGSGGGGGVSSSGTGNVAANDPHAQKDFDSYITKIRHQDMEHAQSTLKAIARDWSAEGAEERDQSYKRIIDAIEYYYNPKEYRVNEVKILVPGCGLGRLTYELACRGYECMGNEFSYFMLIASNFVLNTCSEENMYTLYPWVHHNVNNLRRADQVAGVRFPDVCPAKNKPKGSLTVVAGDFIEVYKGSFCFDCVATCFFIDCANNVVEFIETIYRNLVPGGIWINLGPLLYHFSDIPNENSIEPTYEDIIHVIEAIGFDVLTAKTDIITKYAQNPQSMLKSEYRSLFWICRKPLDSADSDNLSAEKYNMEVENSLPTEQSIDDRTNIHYDKNGYTNSLTN